ncbi:hypothetical protein D3C71_1489030 [compost metagenome]
MGEAFGNEQLLLVLSGEFQAEPFAVARATLTDVNGHIKNAAARTPYQLALRFGVQLEMQAAKRAFYRRIRLIILHKILVNAMLEKFGFGVRLHKPSAMVAKYGGFDDQNALEISLHHFHLDSLFPQLIDDLPFGYLDQVLTVSGLAQLLTAAQELRLRDPSVNICNLLGSCDFDALVIFDRPYKIRGIHETLMRSGIEPGVSATQQFHIQLAHPQIFFIDGRNFKLSAR